MTNIYNLSGTVKQVSIKKKKHTDGYPTALLIENGAGMANWFYAGREPEGSIVVGDAVKYFHVTKDSMVSMLDDCLPIIRVEGHAKRLAKYCNINENNLSW